MNKPIILIEFIDDEVEWKSMGWGNNKALRAAAKRAINEAEDSVEVVEKLNAAGFAVVRIVTEECECTEQ